MNKLSPLEHQEIIDKLISCGYERLIDVLYFNDANSKVYTKRGRLNKCGACRALGCRTKDLEEALRECRRLLGDDIVT